MAFVDHAPHFLALGIEGYHVAAVGTVAAKKVPLRASVSLPVSTRLAFSRCSLDDVKRADGAGNDRSVIVGVELLAAGVQQAAIVVFQDEKNLPIPRHP